MRRFLPKLWAGMGLIAALLTCGCQHNRCCCPSGNAPASATLAPPLASPAYLSSAVTARVPAKAANLPTASTPAPVVHSTAKLNPTDVQRSQDSSPSLSEPSEVVQPPVTTERFGHDPNYRWLVGTLDYSQIQRAWLLRYMSYEEDDRYGGCVTLVGVPPATALKKGKIVRVEGSLIDPESRQLRPAFQVEHIRVAGS